MDFLLFLLVNFTLFVRPGELIPAIGELPLYNCLILAAFAFVAARVVDNIRPNRLARDPITVCVLGMIPAVLLSHLRHFDTFSAQLRTIEFTKVALYYLVLMATVNTTRRLRLFLYAIALFAAIISGLALLHHLEVLFIPTIATTVQSDIDPETGDPYTIARLCAMGIFADPNDLSTIAIFASIVCLFGLGDRQLSLLRFLWLAPLAVLITAIVYTKSRGGMLALVAALGTFSYLRFGKWVTLASALVVLPVVVAVGGRQTDVSAGFSGGTGDDRVKLWSEGLMVLRKFPLFGIGAGNYADEAGQVAHNAFVHCFVEMGLVGGIIFLGAFWFAVASLWKMRPYLKGPLRNLTSEPFRRLHPYLMAMVCGYSVSMLSLSRSYVVPTYLVLGVANAYYIDSQKQGVPALVKLNQRRIGELLIVSVLFLAAVQAFIKFKLR